MSNDLFAADALTLGDYAERAYLDYAVSVVKGRALPDVSDGQKPVQRRILYAMHDMNLDFTGVHGAKAVKSARVVGDVLGKFHPHGDQSAYEALVRLAQDFAMRYPLIDGQGNFGSRDGDGAAAMRYTEARLAPIARLLLDELDEGTVDFQPNYDGSTREPKLLPARLPFVLLNGASGIAVGLATEIPSHNLGEVARAAIAMLKSDGRADVDAMLEHILGPDFPGGGQIISSKAEIAEVYRTGRGSIKVRARWKIEELARGQWQLVITELPPLASAQRIGEEMEELTNPKVRVGKKALTAEQVQTRQLILSMLDRHRDESDKDARVRYVFEPKSRTIDPAEFINTLLAHTSLESSAPVNLVMIGRDGRPQQKNLAQIVGEWVEFRRHCVTRRTEHRLAKTRERNHVLEGRLLVLLNVERVIRVIREADDAKAALIEEFSLSERQAEDVLEIRLRQLARLEGIAIERELAERRADEGKLEELLASPAAMKRLLVREIEADEKAYGDPRRTLIQEDKRAVLEVKVLDEPVTVVVSEKGWVRARSGHGHDAAQFSFKVGDTLYGSFECRTVDTLIAFGSNGRVYSTGVASLPGARGDGAPITSLIDVEPGTSILHFLAGTLETPLLLATSAGNGLFCRLGDLVSRNRGGKSFLALDATAVPLRPEVVDRDDQSRIACLSDTGRLLVFAPNEVKFQAAGGRGVMLQKLDAGERLVAALPIGARGLVVAGTSRSGKEATLLLTGAALEAYAGDRARKGRKIAARFVPARLARPPSGAGREGPRQDGASPS